MTLKNVKSAIQKAKDDMRRKVILAVTESAIMIEADAKLLSPVDTGTLKRSISHKVKEEKDKIIGSVGSNIEYAYWAERHQPYLEPAVDKNMVHIKRKIAEVLKS